jgi:thioredoxin 2
VARAKDRPKCGHCGKPIALDRPLVLGDADFDRLVADAQVPVLVDFYADWCGPCKIMAPVLDQLARDRAGGLLVAKIDTDANPVVSRRFGISSIPTLILFRGGREAGRELGAIPRPRLDALVGPPLA